MTQMTDEEIKLIAETGVNIVHCPESNLKLGSGLCPVNKLINAGANVCLGTDGPASNDDLDLLGEMRTSALLDKYSHNGVGRTLSVYEMLAMATINGAKALGVADKVGSLEVGKEADIIAIRLTTLPVYDPMKTLVYAGTNKVEYVWVAGQCLIYNQKLLTIDERSIKAEAEQWKAKLVTWDKERKKSDLPKVKQCVQEGNALTKDDDVTKKQKVRASLMEANDNLFQWIYFANRPKSQVGATVEELKEVQLLVTEALKKME